MPNLPFGFEAPEESPGFLLWQTSVIWQRQIRNALEPHELSHAHFVILAILMWFENQHLEATQIMIKRETKLDKMTISNSLRRLTELGYVNRFEHKKDTRAKSVFLTQKGRQVLRKLVPLVEGIDHRFFGKLTQSEEKVLLEGFKKLTRD